METDIWTEKAIEKAKKTYHDMTMKKDIQLSMDEVEQLTQQLRDLVFFSTDEKILYFEHYYYSIWNKENIYDNVGKGDYEDGDLIITSSKLIYAEHPITKTKKGFLSSEKTVHHESYIKPIDVKIDLNTIEKISFDKDKKLKVNYADGRWLLFFAFGEDLRDSIKIELEKAIDAYKHAQRKPKPIEVVHKGTVVSLNVNSKGFLLNVDPCPTCGANLFLSQDRKTAYCRYCKKEIPTVEQIRES